MRIDGVSGVGNQPSFPQDSTIDINSSLRATYDLMCNPANTQTSVTSWQSVANFMNQIKEQLGDNIPSEMDHFIQDFNTIMSDHSPKQGSFSPNELNFLQHSLSSLTETHFNISSTDLAQASAKSLADSIGPYMRDPNNPGVHNDTGLQINMLFVSQLDNPNVDALSDRMKTDIQHGNISAVMDDTQQLSQLLMSL